MKTHIIHLQPYDDLYSARDRMNWAKEGRILLIWPPRGSVLNRRLDLILLQRHSLALGAQLALVSRDGEVHYHAAQLGIPIYKSLRAAQKGHWQPPRRTSSAAQRSLELRHKAATRIYHPPSKEAIPTASQPGAVVRLLAFTLGVVAVLLIAAMLSPSATIVLSPSTQTQELLLTLQTSPQAESASLRGVVPIHEKRVVVEGRQTRPASGSLTLPDRFAIGEVVFTNLTDQAVSIPANTVVAHLGEKSLRFATVESGLLPPGPGSTITLPVRALTPGSQGNLPANALTAIEGNLGTQVSVTNPEATRGGSDRLIPAPSAQDRRLLREQLRNALRATASQELQEGLAPGDLLIPDSLELVEMLEETFQPPEGLPGDLLALSLRLEFRGQVVFAQEVNPLIQKILDLNLPSGYLALVESLEVERITPPVLVEPGVYTWQVRARRRLVAHYSPQSVIQTVLGASPQEARQRLQAALKLETAPLIHLTPSWWPRLPFLPFRIEVRSAYEEAGG